MGHPSWGLVTKMTKEAYHMMYAACRTLNNTAWISPPLDKFYYRYSPTIHIQKLRIWEYYENLKQFLLSLWLH